MDKAPEAFRTISEVAEDLDVPQHVLRFWESRFPQIRPMKRGGGRRYYRPDDIDLLRGIRHLLYGQGYTIRGVQRILREQGVGFVQAVWREGAPQPPRAMREEDEAAPTGSRGLLGLLPGFRKPEEADEDADTEAESEAYEAGEDDEGDTEETADEDIHVNGRREPRFEGSAPAPVARAAAPALTREQKLQLQMALDGLGECRRLLDDALKDE